MDELLPPPTLPVDARVALDEPATRAEVRRRAQVPAISSAAGAASFAVAAVTSPESGWIVVHVVAAGVLLPSIIVTVVTALGVLRLRWILARHPWRTVSMVRSAGSPVSMVRPPGVAGAYATGSAVPRRFDADVAGHLRPSNRWGRRAVMRPVGATDLAVVAGPRPDLSESAAPAARPAAELPRPDHLIGEDGARGGPVVVIVHAGQGRSPLAPCGVWLIDGRCVGRIQRRADGVVFLDGRGDVVLEREDRTPRSAAYLVGELDIGRRGWRRLDLTTPATTWTVERTRRRPRHRLLEGGAVVGQAWRLRDGANGESALIVLDRHLAPVQRAAATLELVTMLGTLPRVPTSS